MNIHPHPSASIRIHPHHGHPETGSMMTGRIHAINAINAINAIDANDAIKRIKRIKANEIAKSAFSAPGVSQTP